MVDCVGCDVVIVGGCVQRGDDEVGCWRGKRPRLVGLGDGLGAMSDLTRFLDEAIQVFLSLHERILAVRLFPLLIQKLACPSLHGINHPLYSHAVISSPSSRVLCPRARLRHTFSRFHAASAPTRCDVHSRADLASGIFLCLFQYRMKAISSTLMFFSIRSSVMSLMTAAC